MLYPNITNISVDYVYFLLACIVESRNLRVSSNLGDKRDEERRVYVDSKVNLKV